ncbi:MAG: hypothetical protein JW772_02620 [Candidatus Diapherotrites archaeon]|nr:hypothetical protein [Candidatus Diapherotrites archaeon]
MEVFDKIVGKKGIAEKQLERDRYVQAQINILQSKLQRLERIFSVGMPLSESEETIERLDQIEKGIKVSESKIKMFANVLKEVRGEQDTLLKGLDEKAGLKQVALLSQRVKFLENIYGELSSSKTKDIFMNIVEIMKNLETRIKSMEDIAHQNVNMLFEKEITNVSKKMTEEGKGKPGASLRTYDTTPEYKDEQGFGSKVKGFFNKLIGRK